MINDEQIKNNLNNTIEETNFSELGEKYTGKVRENYMSNGKRIMITTDRISAFDVILGTIPFKGQVLNQIAAYWFEQTKDVAPNHIIEIPDPNVMVVKDCKPFPVEVIVRGYITGSAWRDYEKGNLISGIKLPDGLKKDQKFDEPILTPSTKAEVGHDMPISREEIMEKLVEPEKYKKIEQYAMALFKKGTQLAAQRGLILVDTKYEFGETQDGEIVVIDEIHTPDSSRYWIADEYEKRFANSEEQKMLDKEFIRQWLIKEKNFMGDGQAPEIDESVKIEAAKRYIETYELMTGEEFKVEEGDVNERIKKNLSAGGYI